jgi:hypothetical protein
MKPNQNIIKNLLSELNKRWGLDCLNLEDGRCFVKTDDHIELIIEVPEEVGQILFFAELEPLGHVGRMERLELMMSSNLGDPDLRLAHFGLDQATDRIYLTYHHPIEGMGVQFLENILVNFVQCARSAREKLQNIANLAPSQPMSSSQFSPSHAPIAPPETPRQVPQQKPAAADSFHKPAAGSFRK